jgi:hypothetical protein
MPIGGGKYDDAIEAAHKITGGSCLLVVMPNGKKGGGFSMKATALDYMVLPQILRAVADNIEREYGRA